MQLLSYQIFKFLKTHGFVFLTVIFISLFCSYLEVLQRNMPVQNHEKIMEDALKREFLTRLLVVWPTFRRLFVLKH